MHADCRRVPAERRGAFGCDRSSSGEMVMPRTACACRVNPVSKVRRTNGKGDSPSASMYALRQLGKLARRPADPRVSAEPLTSGGGVAHLCSGAQLPLLTPQYWNLVSVVLVGRQKEATAFEEGCVTVQSELPNFGDCIQ